MAEFLIYCTKHWMDDLTQKEIDEQVKKNPKHFMDKYNARYQWNDFVEVQPNGYWGEAPKHGWNKKIFALIKILSISFKDAKHYMNADVEIQNKGLENEIRILKHRRKYAISTTLQPGQEIEIGNIAIAGITDKAK